MIVTDLFRPRVIAEELEQPITTGFLNPATGKPYLPSELAAKRRERAIAAGRLDPPQPAADPAAEAEKIRKEKQATAAQAAQDEMDGKASAATPGAGAFGAMAQQLGGPTPANTMANSPVSSTNVAKPGNPNAAAPAPVAAPVAAPASTPTVPSLTSAPAKVEPLATASPAKSEPISIGGQTIKPTDPLYAQIMQNAPAGTFDAPAATASPTAAPDLTGAERAVVKDIALKASDMLKTVQTKDDLAKVKAFIDREFAKQGNKYMSEAMFFNRDRLMEQATRIYHRRIS